MMKNILISLLFLMPVSLIAQKGNKEQAKIKAQTQIKQLKEGKLLVRLYNKQQVIKSLEEKGMVKRAQAIKKKQDELNKKIMTSFQNFSFCDVYFFYSNHSTYLINEEYDKVDLYTDSGKVTKEVVLDSNFLVADFGNLESDVKSSTFSSDKKKSKFERKKPYQGNSTNTNMRCMFIRSNKLEQLKRPFPYYVRFHPTPLNNLTYPEVIAKMDKVLKNYYSKQNK